MLRRSFIRHQRRGADRLPLTFQPGHSYCGFAFIESRQFPELNLQSFEFRHEKTNAQYFHFDTPDTNNTFCIGFGTPAQNSKGTTHVLEHTVLCGSAKFPVRDPFFHMLRRSLSTFMNAMTGADYTLYPFATTNAQDFVNLLDVYTDAVFHPLLRPEDFRQEGHRLEVAEAESTESSSTRDEITVKINGVVYNEMRGVVSEPSTVFSHKLMETMLPGTHYEHVSGGFPPDILDLTHEELVAFHRAHYHPSNSITVTYGDLPPQQHMTKMNEMFSRFEASSKVPIPDLSVSNRRSEETVVNLEGPLDPMGSPTEQNRVGVSFAVGDDQSTLDDMVRLVVLDSLLSAGPSSPMYKALLESKLGTRYCPMGGYAYYLSTPIVTYGVEGVSSSLENKEEAVHSAVMETLKEAKASGFDKRRVESVVFQEEMQQKHRTANYGIGLCTTLCALSIVRPNISPCDFVNWLPHLKKIEQAYEKELLPLLDKTFLSNRHSSVLSISASPKYLEELQGALDAREKEANARLSAEEKQKVAVETEQWRARIREPQVSDCLPTLKVCDIPRQGFQEPLPVPFGSRVFTIPHPTNGLVYVHGIAPFSPAVTAALLSGESTAVDPFIGLYHALLGQTGAGQMDFKELSIETELVCGGFRFGANFANRSTHAQDFTAGTSFGFYTTEEKLPAALRLLTTIIASPRGAVGPADDVARSRVLTSVVARCSSKVQSIQRSGNSYAQISAAQNMSCSSLIRERWGGLTNCTASTELLKRLRSDATKDAALDEIMKYYSETAASLQETMGEAVVWATCEPRSMTTVAAALNDFLSTFVATTKDKRENGHIVRVPSKCNVNSSNSSAASVTSHSMPIDTSFVGLAIPNDIHSVLDPRQQTLRVAAQLLKNEYLHRVVREEGGAYGAAAASNLNGDLGGVALSSYRDPTPHKTVEAFHKTSSVLADANYVTQQRLDEAKLRLFAQIDSPTSADTFGESYFMHGASNELRQAVRELLLNVQTSDVVNVAGLFSVTPSASFAVLKPEDKSPEAQGMTPTAE